MKDKRTPVIVSACRTPLGRFMGTISGIPAVELGSAVITEAIRRAGISKEDVQEVIMSQVLPCGCGQNPARLAMVKAGLPWETGAMTINKVCGGGLKAVMLASQAIRAGDTDIVVAGGMENMSSAPHYLDKARTGYRMSDGVLRDHMVHDGLWDVINDFHMGASNDLISEKWEITREAQDRYAAQSYRRAIDAIAAGKFVDQIMPVTVPGKRGETKVFDTDENARETSFEDLSKLKPAFTKNGCATAGNASSISDGACALVVMALETAEKMGLKPMASVRAYGSSGLDMKYVLAAPIKSIPKVLDIAGLKLSDIDLHEVNEAFSGSTLAVMKDLKMTDENVNVNGGSVALGHPIGASGARVLTTLLYEMKVRGAKLGEASLCLGGGESVTLIAENWE